MSASCWMTALSDVPAAEPMPKPLPAPASMEGRSWSLYSPVTEMLGSNAARASAMAWRMISGAYSRTSSSRFRRKAVRNAASSVNGAAPDASPSSGTPSGAPAAGRGPSGSGVLAAFSSASGTTLGGRVLSGVH